MSSSFETADLMPFTTAIVLVSPPCFMTGTYADRWPSTWTTFDWIWLPSSTRPTSLTRTIEPLAVALSGMRLMSGTFRNRLFVKIA